MQRRYLVTYDISNAKRLRRVFKTLMGFGAPLQYSVFQCDLSDVERLKLREALCAVMNQSEDRVLIVDLGPTEGRAVLAFECLGVQREVLTGRRPIVV